VVAAADQKVLLVYGPEQQGDLAVVLAATESTQAALGLSGRVMQAVHVLHQVMVVVAELVQSDKAELPALVELVLRLQSAEQALTMQVEAEQVVMGEILVVQGAALAD
jgi:hypothetical protein